MFSVIVFLIYCKIKRFWKHLDKIVAKIAFFSKSVISVWDIFCVLDYPSQSFPIFILISNTTQGNRHSLDDVFQL